MSTRRPFIAGNWKMNGTRDSVKALTLGLVDRLSSLDSVDVAICPPFPYLPGVHDMIAGGSIALGAQNLYFEPSGAYTGEVSAEMLADCGVTYAIVGHSERRHVLGEEDELINRKLKASLDQRLQPILCVGELLEEHEAGRAREVVEGQVRAGLLGVMPEQLRQVTIAYEPVWAIGTGKVATPDYAEDIHGFIRETLTRLFGADLAQVIRIQYGGSVKPENAAGLLGQPNVDGALVGGASLKAADFAAIVQAAIDLSDS